MDMNEAWTAERAAQVLVDVLKGDARFDSAMFVGVSEGGKQEVRFAVGGGHYAVYFGEDEEGGNLLVTSECQTSGEAVLDLDEAVTEAFEDGLFAEEDDLRSAIDDITASAAGVDESTSPQEGDVTTPDYQTFYQYGKVWLTVPDLDDWEEPVRAKMAEEGHWPDVWFISDHGNPHRIKV